MTSERGTGGGRVAVVRGTALFLGIFALVNVVGSVWWRGFDATVWWVDLRVLPVWAGRGMVAAGGVGLVMVAVNGVHAQWMLRGVRVAVGALLAAAIFNVAEFYAVWGRGEIAPGVVVPLSAGVAVVLGAVLWAAGRPRAALRGWERAVFVAAVAGAMMVFPLAQMFCFGTTDYRRQADAIVVFGALVYRDGTPSQALADRVNTAIALYKDGRAPVLIFSGGPGAGAISEAQAMRTLALSKGVPAAAIVLDEAGLHTDATVRNTAALFAAQGYKRVLAVSHFYHLPRIKMRYERELAGARVDVVTVPAAESQPLVSMPRFVAREVVALWAYYLGLERAV